jgi:hypothetical protein
MVPVPSLCSQLLLFLSIPNNCLKINCSLGKTYGTDVIETAARNQTGKQKQTISDSAPSTPAESRTPQNLHTYDKQICVSDGFGDQVSLCQTIEEGEEFELINSMVDELNSKCSSEVAAGPIIQRKHCGSRTGRRKGTRLWKGPRVRVPQRAAQRPWLREAVVKAGYYCLTDQSIFLLIPSDYICFDKRFKVPKRENFSLGFFALSEPIWVCDIGSGKKIDFFYQMIPDFEGLWFFAAY